MRQKMDKVENKRIQVHRSCIFIRLKRIACLQIVEKEIGKDAFKNMMKHSAVSSSLSQARTQTFHLNSNYSVSWFSSAIFYQAQSFPPALLPLAQLS